MNPLPLLYDGFTACTITDAIRTNRQPANHKPGGREKAHGSYLLTVIVEASWMGKCGIAHGGVASGIFYEAFFREVAVQYLTTSWVHAHHLSFCTQKWPSIWRFCNAYPHLFSWGHFAGFQQHVEVR